MKLFKKIIIVSLALIMLLPTISLADNRGLSSKLIEKIKNNEDFMEYSHYIKSEYVINETITEVGYRILVSYNLTENEGEKTLVFVSDDEFNILFSGIIEFDNNNMILTDFEENSTLEFSIPNDYHECRTEVCTRTRGRLYYDPNPGCSTFVGQPCSYFTIIGKPILSIICRAGVWVACNISYDRICLETTVYPHCLE